MFGMMRSPAETYAKVVVDVAVETRTRTGW